MIRTRSFRYQEKEYQLQAEVVACGEDLCVMISGGDRPHIGAVALAALTPSARDPGKRTATPSVIAVPGHKEHHLALEASEKLAKDLERTVVVTVGIHIDGITPDLIDRVVEEFHKLVADLSAAVLEK